MDTLTNPTIVESGDVDHDGKMDFVVFGTGRNTALAELDAYLGNGDGTFQHLPAQVWPALPDAAGSLPAQLFLADFNHDGKPDLLFAQNDVELGLGNGDGTFQSPTTILRNFGPVAVGDVNHDGYLDLVQARNSGQSAVTRRIIMQADYLCPGLRFIWVKPTASLPRARLILRRSCRAQYFSPRCWATSMGTATLILLFPMPLGPPVAV